MEGQIQIIEDLGKMHVSNTQHNGKDFVHEMTSRQDYPIFYTQTYNQESCNHEVVLYVEHAIIPVEDQAMMCMHQVLGDERNELDNLTITVRPPFTCVGRWTSVQALEAS